MICALNTFLIIMQMNVLEFYTDPGMHRLRNWNYSMARLKLNVFLCWTVFFLYGFLLFP